MSNKSLDEKKYAGLVVRWFAFFIDGVIIGSLEFIFSKLFGFGLTYEEFYSIFSLENTRLIDWNNISDLFNHLYNFSTLLYLVNIFFYFILLEWRYGRTIGKMITRIKVVKQDGNPLDFRSAVLRNLMRLIDVLPFGYIVGAIAIWKSPTKQRLGDQVAGTIVVSK